jgi:hypothetical protein
MQTSFQSGQFKLAIVQHVSDTPEGKAPSSMQVSAQHAGQMTNHLKSLSNESSIAGKVISASLEHINNQQQNTAHYKAQIEVQGKILTVTTQFPLEANDMLELKVNNKLQLVIEKVIPSSQTDPTLLQKNNQPINQSSIDSKGGIKEGQTLHKPINQQQIDSVVRAWLAQSRPVASTLLDLTITLEAVSKVLAGFNNPSTTPAPNHTELGNLMLSVSKSIQTNLFDQLPNTNITTFKQDVQTLLKELISWQTTSPKNTTNNASTAPQQTFISGLNKLQSFIEQTLTSTQREKTTSDPLLDTSKLQVARDTSGPPLPILKDWTQVLTLMTPPTQTQSDLVDWMLESIRRIAGTPSIQGSPTENKQTQTMTNLADSSQWLRLAEFRKHQLFTGNIKNSLLQSTQDTQISNIFRQLLVNIEEFTGRLTALRLASAGSQNDTLPVNHLHIDLPVLTPNGPTAIEIDISEQQDEEIPETSKETKSQWVVHLKFELPPMATFICQLIMNTKEETLSATFFTDHQETLTLLNQHIPTLIEQCEHTTKSSLDISTRFGIIEMPRESIVKKTSQALSVKV